MDEALSRRDAPRRLPGDAPTVAPMADFDGHNAFADDPVLAAALDGAADGSADDLDARGAYWGSADAQEVARLAIVNPPALRREDLEGRPLDQIDMHPAYHALTNRSVTAGLLSSAWEEGEARPHSLRAARLFLAAGCERGHLLPLSATHAAVASLAYAPDLEAELFPLIATRRYDRRPLPVDDKDGVLISLALAEREGAPTRGDLGEGDTMRLNGTKTLVCLPQADLLLVLAGTTEGPTAALVSRHGPENIGAVRTEGLCDLGGLAAQAVATVTLAGAEGRLVGAPGHGLKVLRDMRTLTQLDSAVMAAGAVRRVVARAVHALRMPEDGHAPRIEEPLHARLAADLALTSAAQTALALRLAGAFDGAFERDGDHAIARVLTPAARIYALKSAVAVAAEARDLLAPAGLGRLHPAARAVADLAVLDQWDGSASDAALELVGLISRDRNVLADALDELGADLGSQNADLVDRTLTLGREAEEDPGLARAFADQLAMVGAASAMRRNLPRVVADAFISARLRGGYTAQYATLDSRFDATAIVEFTVPEG